MLFMKNILLNSSGCSSKGRGSVVHQSKGSHEKASCPEVDN